MPAKDNFSETVTSAVIRLINGAFCLTIQNVNEILSNLSHYDKTEQIKAIKDDLLDVYVNLKDTLAEGSSVDSEPRASLLKRCYANRNSLSDMNILMNATEAYVHRNDYFFGHYHMTTNPENKNLRVNKERVADRLENFRDLLNGFDDIAVRRTISKVIGYIPMRTARGLYYDNVFKDVCEMFAYLSESEIDDYIKFCNISLGSGLQTVKDFLPDDIFSSITALSSYEKYFNPEAIIDANLPLEFSKNINEIYDSLDETKDPIYVLFETTNFLIILLNLTPSFNLLTENNFVIKDLYYLIKEGCLNGDFAFDEDVFASKIEEESENLIDEIEDASQNVNKERKKAESMGLPNEQSTALKMFDYAYGLFFEASYGIDTLFYKPFETEKNTSISPETIKAKATQLIEILKSASPEASVRNRKLERQFFLEYVPVRYNGTEFYKYICNSFDNSSDIEVLIAASRIEDILGSYNMQHGEHAHGHMHDDDCCDCGDDCDCDDDCDCGHHH